MNRVILLGRLCKDPETIRKNENTVCKFTLAVGRRFVPEGGENADFIQCVAFKKTADFVAKYFKKGSKICVDGVWRTGKYTNDSGKTVFTNDCVVESVDFADSKKEDGNNEGDLLIVGEDEDDLPF